jgi:hypothetical protein
MEFGNRREPLLSSPLGRGFDLEAPWTSDLNLVKAFPAAGRRLLAQATAEWPVTFTDAPPRPASRAPRVSFLIGHRGEERLPLLELVLRSIAAQTTSDWECVVVEQSDVMRLAGRLPGWVRLVESPAPGALPYSRSWAFNVAARHARGRLLVFHDNDVAVPAAYAEEIVRLHELGFEAMRLSRFVFYLGAAATRELLDGSSLERGIGVDAVRQNCHGHTVVVDRDAYFRIGGHDEGFVGWGGEDNEFYDRLRLLRFHPWGYLPFVHLWHSPQPTRSRPERALDYLTRVRALAPEERASRLAAKPFGRLEGPVEGLVA